MTTLDRCDDCADDHEWVHATGSCPSCESALCVACLVRHLEPGECER